MKNKSTNRPARKLRPPNKKSEAFESARPSADISPPSKIGDQGQPENEEDERIRAGR